MDRWGLCNDNHPTETSVLQTETEDSVFELLSQWQDPAASKGRGLLGLGRGFVTLDASKPWILFWILQALDLLNEKLSEEETEK
ncbi:UNVERIFIED_CONTAM: hypothetical protein HDU68_008397 [Siphonaria sp. JEL0065]|nr:hypothetical protein HDU68_008397 [Siphonaria sp. JEL0065]